MGNARVKTEETWIKQRKKTQEWRKDRQRKDRGENILEKARGDDEVQGTVGGTNSRLEDNPLSLPGGVQRKEAGQRKVCAMQGQGGLLGENAFDNLLASRPSLPAKLSQSLFNGKASPKGSRCGWNQFKCEGAGASSGSLPPFFSSFFFFLPHPAGVQWPPNWGAAPRSAPWGQFSRLY